MRKHRMTGWLPVLLAVSSGGFAARPATAVTVTCGTGSGLAGQTVDISISTSDLTGLNVRSYQFALTYNSSVVTAQSVITTGTLTGTAGWSSINSNITSGRISVAAAGTNALPGGAGVLIKIRFLLNPALTGGSSTGLGFSSFTMNEGTPPVTSTSGSITINATPQIFVSPDNAEIIRGRSLAFSAYGSVTNPVSWNISNPAVATINSSAILRGLAVGSTKVFAVDAASLRDTTNGLILIRGMGDSVGTATVYQGQVATVQVYATRLDSLNIRSGQFSLSWNALIGTLSSVTTPPGTLLNGYGTMDVHIDNALGTVSLDFAATTNLSSTTPQPLFNLNFTATTTTYGGTGVALNTALFNETLPAVRSGGAFYVNPLPTLSISPDQVSLLAGQTQPFTIIGAPVLPITWSTLDPTVATINSSGLLTAVAGGVTRVKAVDAVGATALTTSVTVYDFKLTIPPITAPPGAIVHVPLNLDRVIGGLNVYSFQYSLSYTPTWVTALNASPSGLLSTWSPPTVNSQSGLLRLAAAGDHALGSNGKILEYLDFTISALTPVYTDIPLSLSALLFNEGHPIPLVANGVIHVNNTADAPNGAALEFALSPAEPNPAEGRARIAFTIPQSSPGGERVSLVVYGLDGRRFRTLVDGPRGAGRYQPMWDALDNRGRRAPAGIYFARLEWRGRHLERKFALLK